MKLRMGFVSNSSSSSFIVGIAEILDIAKFDAYIEKHNITLDDWNLYVVTEDSEHSDLLVTNDQIIVESFETQVATDRKKPGTTFFVANISNNEGDQPFWNDRCCEMNYEIDIDYFGADQRKVYDAFFDKDSGLNLENDVRFGASRNG